MRRKRVSNREFTILGAVTGRTATTNSDPITIMKGMGLLLFINITSNPSAVNLDPSLRFIDVFGTQAGGQMGNMSNRSVSSIFMWLPPIPNLVGAAQPVQRRGDFGFPAKFQLRIVPNAANPVDYSVTGQWIG